MRHYCGLVDTALIGKNIELFGWVDSLRELGHLQFILLRDREGIVQVTANSEKIAPELFARIKALNLDGCIRVCGTVRERDAAHVNPKMKTGKVEVDVEELEVLNPCQPLPFAVVDDVKASEELRLKYRYLDMRRPKMQEIMRLRHKAAQATRNYLSDQGFWEIETPILTKSTPEGARDFLVPSRLQKGKFYALPQSPQLFKQLSMVSGFDRYFQLARCFRDEDLRADRQLEFTQIDIEASFINEAFIYDLIEGLLKELFGLIGAVLPSPFPRLTYDEATALYGSDKPDLRIPLKISDCSPLFGATAFIGFQNVLKEGGSIRALHFKGQTLSRKILDELVERGKKEGIAGVTAFKWEEGQGKSPIAKFFSPEEMAGLKELTGAENGDLTLMASGTNAKVLPFMGSLRLEFGRQFGLLQAGFHPLWITDFPLVEWNADENRWDALHHPFTSPQEGEADLLSGDAGRVKARAYDVVMNGYELGGGSIRIHRPDVQQKVFSAIGITPEKAKEKFGFLLEAFQYGAPPHGGVALGFDRLVMLLAGLDSIRDCIPFPKTTSGTCLLTQAPSEVDDRQLAELGIRPVE